MAELCTRALAVQNIPKVSAAHIANSDDAKSYVKHFGEKPSAFAKDAII